MCGESYALEALGVTAGYGGPPIVRDVSLVCRKAEITVLLGPNGAGKSTLLKALVGSARRSAGELVLFGEKVPFPSQARLVKAGISYIPQSGNVFPSLTVRENLEMGGITRSATERRALIVELCELFPDLTGSLRRPAWMLSGGQRSMLALARGLMCRPSVLLVDELTAGLAVRYEELVWGHLERARDGGLTVLVVEQNVRRALQSADWAYVLVAGEVAEEGSPAKLMEDERIVALYFGNATAPFLPANIEESVISETESEGEGLG
jgi:branched-chain amino acid transport system ATP-binding protein